MPEKGPNGATLISQSFYAKRYGKTVRVRLLLLIKLLPTWTDLIILWWVYFFISFVSDIAWDLIQHYPRLAFTKDLFDESPIYALASVPSSFQCGKRLIFWKQWIYNSY
jgi:hypothetical protein